MKTQEKAIQSNRRQLLKMMASSTVSAPLIKTGLLTASAGFASVVKAASSIKNVVFVFIPGGAPGGASRSITPDAAFNLKPASAPLEPVKDECVFFSNTDMEGYAGHGLPQNSLGGLTKSFKTIDLALGEVIGGTTPFSSIQLGVLAGNTSVSSANWKKSLVISDPTRAFEILRSVQASNNPELQKQRTQLEINLRAAQQLQQQLGGFADARLQANVDAIAQLQADLPIGGYGPSCDLQQHAWPDEAINPNDGQAFTRLWELQTGNAVTAIRCGLTRVVTMIMGNDEDDFTATGFNYTYAAAANAFGTDREYTAYRAYLSERLAYLIQQLKITTDINGAPLLDSTLVVQVTNMGDTSINIGSNAPFMIAGGGNAIQRRQVVKAPLHTQVLDTVALAMGAYGIIAPYSAAGPIPGVVV